MVEAAALERQIEALERECQVLEVENSVYESFLRRNPVPDDVLSKLSETEKGRSGKKSKRPAAERIKTTLTPEQKLEIATTELEELHKETKEAAKSSEQLLESLRAVLEETDIRIAELKKEAYEFKRDIVVGAENFRTGKTMAEKVIRYMEDKLRQKDALIDKLRLKNGTLRSQIKKVEQQLAQKEEMGDVLHYIDFHQLQIENKQDVATIEQRNQELLRLKMTTGRTVQVLNNLKKRLADLTAESSWLQSEISGRTALLAKISKESQKVEEAIRQLQSTNSKLKTRKEDTAGMPEVLDYVKQKAEMYELENAVRNWERKLEIATMGLKRAQTMFKAIAQ